MCHTLFWKKKQMWQKKPVLIIQVFNSLKPHHFRWSTPIMMFKRLWRLSIYFVSDLPHIVTFTVLWLHVYRIRSTSRSPTSNRILVEEFVPEPSFVNKLVKHNIILFFRFSACVSSKTSQNKNFFLLKGFLCSKRFSFL